MERRLFSKRDLPVLVLIAVAAVIWLMASRSGPDGTVAVVERDGTILLTRELGALTEPEQAVIEGGNGITLTVELSKDGARVLEAGCPDKTCQRTGLLTRAGESAVCLPGRIVLRLEGPESKDKFDAETY